MRIALIMFTVLPFLPQPYYQHSFRWVNNETYFQRIMLRLCSCPFIHFLDLCYSRSNGPGWVELLAKKEKLEVHNYAQGGATIDNDVITGFVVSPVITIKQYLRMNFT